MAQVSCSEETAVVLYLECYRFSSFSNYRQPGTAVTSLQQIVLHRTTSCSKQGRIWLGSNYTQINTMDSITLDNLVF